MSDSYNYSVLMVVSAYIFSVGFNSEFYETDMIKAILAFLGKELHILLPFVHWTIRMLHIFTDLSTDLIHFLRHSC